MMIMFAKRAIESRMRAPIGLRQEEVDSAQALLEGKYAGCAVKNGIVITTVITAAALAACTDMSQPQTVATPSPHEQSAPIADTASVSDDLNDLAVMTFTCPKAGLNAAARRAAEIPSQGTYQFAYFNIIDESHHALYEVHFKSSYEGESDLKYCVSIYCQQGWDPETTVTLMNDERQPGGVAPHGADCGHQQVPAKR
jgi:hypothetical protein